MAGKLPWMQWTVADYHMDTAMLSPASRGIWVDFLGAMHMANQCGELRGTIEQLARIGRCSPEECDFAVNELDTLKVADVKRDCNGVVTIINRRMKRESKQRVDTKLRVNRHRGNGHCNGDVTPENQDCNADCNASVTRESQSQSQSHIGGESVSGHSDDPVAKAKRESDSDQKPPKFEPVKLGLYLREYDALIADAKAEIKRIKANDRNWIWDMTQAAADLVVYLRKQGGEDVARRVADVEADRRNYERTALKSGAAATVKAWGERIRDIQLAKSGVK